MDSNYLGKMHEQLEELEKPIRAPLEYLNVANCELDDIPDLGPLPSEWPRWHYVWHIYLYISHHLSTDLWQLNASVNALHNLSMDKLGSMCHLSVIDLTRTQMTPCACQRVTNHLMTIGANTKFVPVCMGKLLLCSSCCESVANFGMSPLPLADALDGDACPLPYNRTVDAPTFRDCLASAELAEVRHFWIFTAGCFGGVLLVMLGECRDTHHTNCSTPNPPSLPLSCLVFCYCILRWRRRRRNRRLSRSVQNRKHLVISPRNATNHRLKEDEPLHCDTA